MKLLGIEFLSEPLELKNAACENRTRIPSLGSSYFAIQLKLHLNGNLFKNVRHYIFYLLAKIIRTNPMAIETMLIAMLSFEIVVETSIIAPVIDTNGCIIITKIPMTTRTSPKILNIFFSMDKYDFYII